MGAQARNEPGRLKASSKIVNSVVTTGSNNWYQSRYPRSEKLNPIKKISSVTYGGGTRCVTKGEIVGGLLGFSPTSCSDG